MYIAYIQKVRCKLKSFVNLGRVRGKGNILFFCLLFIHLGGRNLYEFVYILFLTFPGFSKNNPIQRIINIHRVKGGINIGG